MSAQANDCLSDEDIKKKCPELSELFKTKGVSNKAATALIKDEEITSVAALEHLKVGTINKLQISDTQKEILKSMVKKPSGGVDIEAARNTITVGHLKGEASLVSLGGAAAEGGIKLEENKLKAARVDEGATLTGVKRNHDDKK